MSLLQLTICVYTIFILPLFGAKCCYHSRDIILDENHQKTLKEEPPHYDCNKHESRSDCTSHYFDGCSWFCDIKKKKNDKFTEFNQDFNAKHTFDRKIEKTLVDEEKKYDKLVEEYEKLTMDKKELLKKPNEKKEEIKKNEEELKQKQKELDKCQSEGAEKETVYNQDILDGIAKTEKAETNWFKKYDLLTFDKTGKGEIYEFTEDFRNDMEKAKKSKNSEMEILKKLFTKKEKHNFDLILKNLKSGEKTKELQKSCLITARKQQQGVISGDECTDAFIPVSTRRRLSVLNNTFNDTISRRRRLPQVFTRWNAGLDPNANPQKSAGMLLFRKCARYQGDCRWEPNKIASGVVIIEKQREGGQFMGIAS